MVVAAEVPGLASDVLSSGPEHGALDGHPSVGAVVVPRGEQPLDREPEEHDSLLLVIEVPSRNLVRRLERRHRADLEPHLLQFRPGASEELHGRAHGEVEPVDTTVERCQGRTHDLAASETAMATVSSTAARSGGGAGTTRHSESLGRVCGPGRRGIRRSWEEARSLAGMDARLCSKVGCAREAVATLTYDYGDQMAALGPLGLADHPHAHDLCAQHADRLSVPAGWLVVRHEALRA